MAKVVKTRDRGERGAGTVVTAAILILVSDYFLTKLFLLL